MVNRNHGFKDTRNPLSQGDRVKTSQTLDYVQNAKKARLEPVSREGGDGTTPSRLECLEYIGNKETWTSNEIVAARKELVKEMKELSKPHNDYPPEMAPLEEKYFQKPCAELLPDQQETTFFSKYIYDSLVRNKPELSTEEVTKLKEAYSRMEEWVKYREGIKPDFSKEIPSNKDEVEIIKLRCEAYIETLSQQVEQYGPDAVRECQNNAQKYLEVINNWDTLGDRERSKYINEDFKEWNKSVEEVREDIDHYNGVKPDFTQLNLDTPENIARARQRCEMFLKGLREQEAQSSYDPGVVKICEDNTKKYLDAINNWETLGDEQRSKYINKDFKEWNKSLEEIKRKIDDFDRQKSEKIDLMKSELNKMVTKIKDVEGVMDALRFEDNLHGMYRSYDAVEQESVFQNTTGQKNRMILESKGAKLGNWKENLESYQQIAQEFKTICDNLKKELGGTIVSFDEERYIHDYIEFSEYAFVLMHGISKAKAHLGIKDGYEYKAEDLKDALRKIVDIMSTQESKKVKADLTELYSLQEKFLSRADSMIKTLYECNKSYKQIQEDINDKKGIKPNFLEIELNNAEDIERAKERCESFIKALKRKSANHSKVIERCQRDISEYLKAVEEWEKLTPFQRTYQHKKQELREKVEKCNQSVEKIQENFDDIDRRKLEHFNEIKEHFNAIIEEMESEKTKKVTGILKEVYPAYGRDMQEWTNEVSKLAGQLVSDLSDFLSSGEKIFSKDYQKEFDGLNELNREFRQEFAEPFSAVSLLSNQQRSASTKIQSVLLEIKEEWNNSIKDFKDKKIPLDDKNERMKIINFEKVFGSFVGNADHVNKRVELLEKFENIRLRTIKEVKGFLDNMNL